VNQSLAPEAPVEEEGREFLVVQLFPVVEVSNDRELVRAPREWRTLTQHPSVREAA
jgi:hypothetical protein